MGIANEIKDIFNAGDPEVRTWFMVDTAFWPIFLSLFYVFFVKIWGPSLMRDRKPINLNNIMITYNFLVVSIYTLSLGGLVYYTIRYNLFYLACKEINLTSLETIHPIYKATRCAYIIYLVKYLEYLDTVFFILRKRYSSITNLHLIHHAILPLICWYALRSESTGYQAIPAIINGCIHILMYSYYGIAAMGSSYHRFLWWKRYLTMLQMTQFVVIIFLSNVAVPLIKCRTSRHGLYVNLIAATGLLLLFYNFYRKTYFSQNKLNEKVMFVKDKNKCN